MRERHDEIKSLGAEIVAIGTGDARYAAVFVKDERTWKATRATSKRGYHVHKKGKRVAQLGATFVVGPGDVVRYEHLDADSTDHAAVDTVIEVLRARR